MIHSKPADTHYPILPVVANRWSPVSYSDDPVEKEKVMSLLEAARWAPSAYNEQPWQYIVGYKGDDIHSKLSETLAEGNAWAKKAGVLMLSVAKNFFEHKHKPNRHYMHDVGMATMAMVLQATEMDLITHQMSGYSVEKARELFDLDDEHEPASMIAIGYPGRPESDEARQHDEARRERKGIEEMMLG